MKKTLSYIYGLTGLGCLGYWLLIGVTARFGLDMHWIWLVVGGALTLAGAVCRWERIPGWIRIFWRGLMCAGLALVIAMESFVISGMNDVPPENLDYLIVLGARVEANGQPSKALKRRIDAAAEYLHENPGTLAIASGGKGADEVMSEAECIKSELMARGVGEDRILMEDRSTTTSENMEFSMGMITPGAETTVGIVTNNYHVSRALLLAKQVLQVKEKNVYGLAADYTGYTLLHYMMRDGACTIADKLLGNL